MTPGDHALAQQDDGALNLCVNSFDRDPVPDALS